MRLFNSKREGRMGIAGFLGLIGCISLFGQTNNLTIKQKDSLITEVINIAHNQIGIREATGNNDGFRVEEYLRSVGLKKGNPYCVAGIYWCYLKADIQLILNNPAYSPNWSLKPMKLMYTKGKTSLNMLNDIEKGDVMLFYMKNKQRIGHGELIDYPFGDNFVTVGFNTSGTDTDNGDGVRRMIRSKMLAHKIVRPIESKFKFKGKIYN